MQLTNLESPYIHLPLSINQERVLLGRELSARNSIDPPTDNLAVGTMLSGPLYLDVLEGVLNTILRRHLGLRSSIFPNAAISHSDRQARLQVFANTGLFESGMFLQSIVDDVRLSIQLVDLSSIDPAKCDNEIRLVLQEQKGRPFDFRKPPPMRACLLKLEERKHLLLLIVGHIVADGWSMNVLHKEIRLLYEAALNGVSKLPCIPISFADFSVWQNTMLRTSHFNEDARYWRQQWAEFGSARIGLQHLPFVRPTPKRPDFAFSSVRTRFSSDEAAKVRAFVQCSRSTLYMFFVMVYIVILHHYTGKQRLAIWAHFSNRVQIGVEHTVGYFINTHLLGFVCSDSLHSAEFLKQVRSVVMNASVHQQMPILHLWKRLRCHPRFGDANLLLDLYTTRDNNESGTTPSGELRFQQISLPGAALARFSRLGIYVENHEEGLSLQAQYASPQFPESAVVRMMEDMKVIAMAIIAEPEQLISSFAHVAEKYSGKRDPRPRGMDEFVIAGSDLIPRVPQSTTSSLR